MFLNNMNIVVMFANPYSLKDEASGEVREGLSLEYYVHGENGEALKPVVDAGSGALGIRRAKCSIGIDMKEKLMYVPGIYDAQFEMTVGSDGKPVLKVVAIDFVGKCSIILDSESVKADDAVSVSATDKKDSAKK